MGVGGVGVGRRGGRAAMFGTGKGGTQGSGIGWGGHTSVKGK